MVGLFQMILARIRGITVAAIKANPKTKEITLGSLENKDFKFDGIEFSSKAILPLNKNHSSVLWIRYMNGNKTTSKLYRLFGSI